MATIDLPTHAQLYAASKSAVTAADTDLTDFEEGSRLDALTGASADMADESNRVGVYAFRDALVETAEGAALDAIILDRNGPERNAAAKATTTLTVTRTTYVGAHTINTSDVVSGTTATGATITFVPSATVVIGSGDASASVAVIATATGRDYNVPAGTLDTIDGLPAGFTVTQSARAAGGAAEELDAAYRARYKLDRLARQGGTVAAIKAGALSVDGVSYAAVDETTAPCAAGGFVSVYIGDPDAAATSVLVEAVEDVMVDYRPAGVEVRVFASAREELTFAFTVKVKAGSGITAADVKAALIAYLDEVDPGETYYASRGETAIHDISRDLVLSVDQTTPAARTSTPTNAYNAIRTASDGSDITVTVTEV